MPGAPRAAAFLRGSPFRVRYGEGPVRSLVLALALLGALAGCAAGSAPPPAPVAQGAALPAATVPSVSVGELRGAIAATPGAANPAAANQGIANQGTDTMRGAGLAPSRPVAVVAVLASDEEPRGDDDAFALVLSERGPRAEALCAAMLERMDLVAMQQGARPRYARRPVFWMVTPTAQQLATLSDISCPELVAQLDIQRANAVGLGPEIGPVLVAAATQGQSSWTMRWDLSDIPPSEFPRTSRIWNDLLTSPPAQWEARANRVQWRESARAFLIRYGEPLEGALGSRSARAEVSRAQVRYVIVR